MSVWARSDVASITVSKGHKGCGQIHVRPAPGGRPVDVWQLDCPGGCEEFLRTDRCGPKPVRAAGVPGRGQVPGGLREARCPRA